MQPRRRREHPTIPRSKKAGGAVNERQSPVRRAAGKLLPMAPRKFYGWWITAAAFVTFGLSVGVPYYNIGFFYDYFQRQFGWSRADITLGFPLAALLTIWIGPLLIHRFSPRKLILGGTVLSALALAGFAVMGRALSVYYVFWVVYTMGYIFSGPIPHQLIVSNWFRLNRGKAMGIVYVGVGLLGSLGAFLVKPLTEKFGYHVALFVLAGLVLLSWPIVLAFLKDRPSDIGQNPDGLAEPPRELKVQSLTFAQFFASWPFWLLLIGSFCSIGSIGAINFHMKFVFLDQGFQKGRMVDGAWQTASILILWSSIGGRLLIGSLADKFSKKWVMTATYVLVAITIPILLAVRPSQEIMLYAFALLFGFGMGADYMLIPLMAAEQFGVNSLARAMAVILPVNTIGQTWFPYFVSILRERYRQLRHRLGGRTGDLRTGRALDRDSAASPRSKRRRAGRFRRSRLPGAPRGFGRAAGVAGSPRRLRSPPASPRPSAAPARRASSRDSPECSSRSRYSPARYRRRACRGGRSRRENPACDAGLPGRRASPSPSRSCPPDTAPVHR